MQPKLSFSNALTFLLVPSWRSASSPPITNAQFQQGQANVQHALQAAATGQVSGTLNVKPSGVVVNGVNMVNGNAKLDCKADALHIDGFVGFGCG